MTARAQKLILDKLPGHEPTAIQWINNAIEKGWRGIYEPDSGRKTNAASQQLVNHYQDPVPDMAMRKAF